MDLVDVDYYLADILWMTIMDYLIDDYFDCRPRLQVLLLHGYPRGPSGLRKDEPTGDQGVWQHNAHIHENIPRTQANAIAT